MRKHTIVAHNLVDVTFGDCLAWLETKTLKSYHAFYQCSPAERPTIEQFILGCRSMDTTVLETFILDDIFDIDSPSPGLAIKGLSIPRARDVTLADCVDNVHRVIPLVSWPLEARLELSVVFDDATPPTRDSLSSVATCFGRYGGKVLLR